MKERDSDLGIRKGFVKSRESFGPSSGKAAHEDPKTLRRTQRASACSQRGRAAEKSEKKLQLSEKIRRL